MQTYLETGMDWSKEIHIGFEIGEDNENPAVALKRYLKENGIPMIGLKVCEGWYRYGGGHHSELVLLAVMEVLGDQLEVSKPTHRDGTPSDNRLAPPRQLEEVVEEVASYYVYSRQAIWKETCRYIALQYGVTQGFYSSQGLERHTLYRGVSGDGAEAGVSAALGYTCRDSSSRTLESWTNDWNTAHYFSHRGGWGYVITDTIPTSTLLATWETSDMVSHEECEWLIINPTSAISTQVECLESKVDSSPYFETTSWEEVAEFRGITPPSSEEFSHFPFKTL